MESLFSFFFKYRPLIYREGDFNFIAPWPVLVTLGVLAAAAAIGIFAYTRAPGRATRVERGVMVGLRLAALAVLLFCLYQPVLVLSSVVPQRNFLAVLIDDSRSMNLADTDGETRAQWVRENLGGEESELIDALEERFTLRFFRFSDQTSRVATLEELTFDGTRTDLAAAMTRAREELSAVPTSGLIVISDGADNAGTPLPDAIVPLQAASIPVFTVGLGDEAVTPDVQVDQIELPRRVLQGSSLVVDVVVTGTGVRNAPATLVIENEDRILTTRQIELTDGEPTVVPVRVTLEESGPQHIRVRVPPLESERVTQNNVRSMLVDVLDRTEKILFFEGEPRYEVKFMRRAIADDENIQLVLLQRTAENKYLRLDVDDGQELAQGFPTTREELFQYRGLVIGSIEAGHFTNDQLNMIADFASQRGGGVLFTGGRNAYSEGDYIGTPVEDVLPVFLEPPAEDPRDAYTELLVHPTPAGVNHPATQILEDSLLATDESWNRLPPLSTLNRVVREKPGATVLLEGAGTGGDRIVLAHHRYGRGKVMALPIQDTWLWQMHYDIPLDDPTHENFWGQLLRWLVDGVPDRVGVTAEREQVEPGETVRLTAEVADSAYAMVNDAEVIATVTRPDGTVQVSTLDWTVEEDGQYAGTFTAVGAGIHEVLVEAHRGDVVLGADEMHVRAGPSDVEFFDAGQRISLLRRVAEETGGQYYTEETVASMPDDLQYTGGGVTLTEEMELWDMPALFLLLVALVGGEWILRRRRGLV